MNQTISTINLAELLHELGDIDEDRIVWDIEPGTATIDDMQDDAFPMCELIDGTIVRKAMGKEESIFALCLGSYFIEYIRLTNGGQLSGEAALVRLFPQTTRAADLAFTSRARLDTQPNDRSAIATLIPNLMVEILSISNRPGEIKRKRTQYFQAGVELVWQIDPRRQIVDVFTDVDTSTRFTVSDTLDGGSILPNFSIVLADLFSLYEGQH